MRIAVDALSVTNLSGRRVLLGHLDQMARAHAKHHHFVVLIHHHNRDLIRPLGEHVHWQLCPRLARHWTGRVLWQLIFLGSLLKRQQIDLLISPSGALVPGTALPQIVLAQNPWCFVPAFHRTLAARLKAALQRRSYRQAQRSAWALFCNSAFLADLYARNAGGLPRPEPLLANGIDAAIFAAAMPVAPWHSRELDILTVSVMTPHKDIEVVIDALALLHAKGIPARLTLLGPWADRAYQRRIQARVDGLSLGQAVRIKGWLSKAELHHHYRTARVFCLLSRCESFGLPAVEAQAFGTPSVVADAGAPPEVAGSGALVVPAGDAAAAATALAQLLTDPSRWHQLSQQALANAERFRWSRVSRPLVELLGSMAMAPVETDLATTNPFC